MELLNGSCNEWMDGYDGEIVGDGRVGSRRSWQLDATDGIWVGWIDRQNASHGDGWMRGCRVPDWWVGKREGQLRQEAGWMGGLNEWGGECIAARTGWPGRSFKMKWGSEWKDWWNGQCTMGVWTGKWIKRVSGWVSGRTIEKWVDQDFYNLWPK